MLFSDWSSDVFSSYLDRGPRSATPVPDRKALSGRPMTAPSPLPSTAAARRRRQRIEQFVPQSCIGAEFAQPAIGHPQHQTGRETCRESGCQYVWISWGAVYSKKKTQPNTQKTK